MRKNNIEPIDEDPMEDFCSSSPPMSSSSPSDVLEMSDTCPYFDIMMHTILLSRPFGIVWDNDKMEKFLSKRGYKIIEKHYTDEDRAGETYKVAIKPGYILPIHEVSNIRETFDSELQDVILGWIDKIG